MAGKKPAKKKSRWRTVRRAGYVVVALALVVPILGFMAAYVVQDVPRPGDLETNQVATIYAADGTSEIARVVPPEGNRQEVDISQIPEHVRNAVLAAEDREFYSNPGFSVTGFARAARDNVLGRESAGGGSTITQQYVKNTLVGDERSMTRKLKELVISSKMAREWSKDDILAAYLNTIYFGRGAYGISAAANAYFDKPVEELTVEEGAVLAASIQLPSVLDPEVNPDRAQQRWNYVLDGMVASGWVDEATRATMQYPPYRALADLDAASQQSTGPEGHVKNQVLGELSAAGISENQLNTEGLQITTTIDPKAQQAAVDGARNNLDGEPDNLRTAVVSVDPRTGGVVAYYGGEDGNGYDFANAGLQTGSSFKVFGLAAGLDQGIPLSAMYDSSPLTVNGISIGNVEGESCGTCTIAEALKRSLNTSFYRLQADLDGGPQAVADMAHLAGIPEEIPGVGPSLTEPNGAGPNNGVILGQYQSRPLDMASAYATLAASGTYRAPHFIEKVVTADGNVLLDRSQEQEQIQGEQRIDEAVADNTTAAMAPIAAYSRGHALAGGRPSASKTGTAQLGDTGMNKDAWMVGYTPSMSTAVWVGTPDGEPLVNSYGGSIYGSGLPSDIWKSAMDASLRGTDVESFPRPGSIGGQAGVPQYTGPAPSTTTEAPRSTLQLPTEIPDLEITQRPVEILPGVTIPIPGLQQRPEPEQPPQTQQPPGAGADPGGQGGQNGGENGAPQDGDLVMPGG
ncbi:transglycosylase domain-containing protein [Rhodococcus rhodnii]|uniref:Peptidoglycan glycosyltransferase n=2 Tax=Rhodococcus rhodnii TaxID=38312 RepID=R7WNV2_9NOCA|nr:transglycosylase domain-containing protein [Rhodococcus rhodnii]EOM76950.1 peptidoglycan glycosyltransferase [Rhodococcus rhodnii LMG 5362]